MPEVEKNDFSVGSVKKSIVKLAIPLTLAQLINVLYNVVDRIYIGHLAENATDALSGVGLALPIITLITGFANLFGMGGASLASIARGAHEKQKAESIMGTSFTMLLLTGAVLTALTIVLGMRMMGAMLISSLVIFPALTAMRLFKSFRGVMICAGTTAVVCFCAGLTASWVWSTPVGASVVAANLTVFLASCLAV